MSNAIGLPPFSSREIRLWWPLPLAVIIWLAVIWRFGYLLTSPRLETAPFAPIEASFVELSEVAPVAKRRDPEPRAMPRQASKPGVKPRPAATPRAEVASAMPLAPAEPAPVADSPPPTDLMAYVNAARERRRAAGVSAGATDTAAAQGPTPEQIRMANIMRNLQPQGTRGVFQIVSMGGRSAKYSFLGWKKDAGNARRELIEVQAAPGGDLEREIVRSMIELIRRHYQGDFNWESHRLDRIIILSARIEDNAGLEDFLMREFFSSATGSYGSVARN